MAIYSVANLSLSLRYKSTLSICHKSSFTASNPLPKEAPNDFLSSFMRERRDIKNKRKLLIIVDFFVKKRSLWLAGVCALLWSLWGKGIVELEPLSEWGGALVMFFTWRV